MFVLSYIWESDMRKSKAVKEFAKKAFACFLIENE